jgi:hypothetical protein
MAGPCKTMKNRSVGRPRGVKNQSTKAREAAIRDAAARMAAHMPDGYQGDAHTLLVSVYRDVSMPLDVRIDAAKAAVKYERPALQATTITEKSNLDELTPEQLMELALALRAAVGRSDPPPWHDSGRLIDGMVSGAVPAIEVSQPEIRPIEPVSREPIADTSSAAQAQEVAEPVPVEPEAHQPAEGLAQSEVVTPSLTPAPEGSGSDPQNWQKDHTDISATLPTSGGSGAANPENCGKGHTDFPLTTATSEGCAGASTENGRKDHTGVSVHPTEPDPKCSEGANPENVQKCSMSVSAQDAVPEGSGAKPENGREEYSSLSPIPSEPDPEPENGQKAQDALFANLITSEGSEVASTAPSPPFPPAPVVVAEVPIVASEVEIIPPDTATVITGPVALRRLQVMATVGDVDAAAVLAQARARRRRRQAAVTTA